MKINLTNPVQVNTNFIPSKKLEKSSLQAGPIVGLPAKIPFAANQAKGDVFVKSSSKIGSGLKQSEK